MADAKKFAARMLADEPDPKVVDKDRQHTSRAFMLALRMKSGRHVPAVAWAMFNDLDFSRTDDGDVLTLLFAHRIITITGRNLEPLLLEIESERVREIRELDEPSAALADADGQPVVTHIEVLPDVKARIAEILNRTEQRNGLEPEYPDDPRGM